MSKIYRSADHVESAPPLTMGSLFDGISGFPLASIMNGIVPVWASEIEPFPIEVAKHHFPDMLQLGDITKLHGGALPPVDIICGGSPCQDCLWPARELDWKVRVPAFLCIKFGS